MKFGFGFGAGGLSRSKLGINIAALFNEQPGRNGFFFGDSYDEIIRGNLSALGSELSPGTTAAVWAGAKATASSAGGLLTVTYTATGSPHVAAPINHPGGWLLVRAELASKTSPNNAQLQLGLAPNGVEYLQAQFSGAGGTVFAPIYAPAGLLYVSLGFGETAIGQNSVWKTIAIQTLDYSKCSLFDDLSATVPVLSVFQSSRGRGLLLDRSKGSSWGSELCPDGLFNAQGAWILGSGAAISGGVLSLPTLSTSNAQYPVATEAGRVYRVTAKASANAFCGAWSGLGQSGVLSDIAGTNSSTSRSGQIAFTFKATGATSYVVFSATGSTTPTIDNVSVVALPLGNHLVQPTAAARGEFSRGYNQFNYTEDLTNAAWVKTSGTATATLFTATVAGNPRIQRLLATPLSVTVRLRAFVAAGTMQHACLGVHDGGGGTVRGNRFSLTGAGSVVTSTSAVGTITAADGGYWITSEFTIATATPWYYCAPDENTNLGSAFPTAPVGASLNITKLDMRFAADAISNTPAYQRVGASGDYDEVGFPAFHREQTDDSARVLSVDPAGGTKMLMAWAGQRMATGFGVIAESSAIADSTPGTFNLSSDAVGWAFRSTGSASALTQVAASLPDRAVLLAEGAPAADLCRLSVNGVAYTSATDQGSGAYTAQTVHLGARNSTSNAANIRTFAPPMLMFMQPADPGLSAGQIATIQKRFAKAVGVTL